MPRPAILIIVLLTLCPPAWALINFQYTPRHMFDQADLVVAGALAGEGEHWKMRVEDRIKGDAPAAFLLGLGEMEKEPAQVIRALLADGPPIPAVLVIAAQARKGQLHVGGAWLDVVDAGEHRWRITGLAPHMAGTFTGGSGTLVRMLKHLADHPDAAVPLTAGVKWSEQVVAGRADGATALAVVEWPQPGKPAILVADIRGDRLLAPRDKENEFVDITQVAGITSKSALVAMLDVDGDGACDQVNYDGTAVNVLFGGKTFKPGGPKWAYKIEDCIGLSPCSIDGRPGVLLSTKGVPVLLTATAEGWKETSLPGFKGEALSSEPQTPNPEPSSPAATATTGKVSPCIVADLDNDGYVDILQPGDTAGVLWKGGKDGFAPPVKSNVCTGGGVAIHALGDFHENGLIDIFLSGPQKNTLWANNGKGGFADVFRLGGSLSYKCAPGAAAIAAMDLNHDGRADLCLSYPSGELQYHFNRGFGCMGEEREVRLTGAERTPLKSFASADFNGDGSLDLAILQNDGTIRIYYNDRIDQPVLTLRLPKGVTGPVTVACWTAEKAPTLTGVAIVSGHAPGVCLPVRDKGNVVLKYQFPGRPAASMTVQVPEGVREVILDPGAASK